MSRTRTYATRHKPTGKVVFATASTPAAAQARVADQEYETWVPTGTEILDLLESGATRLRDEIVTSEVAAAERTGRLRSPVIQRDGRQTVIVDAAPAVSDTPPANDGATAPEPEAA